MGRFLTRALNHGPRPTEVSTDEARLAIRGCSMSCCLPRATSWSVVLTIPSKLCDMKSHETSGLRG